MERDDGVPGAQKSHGIVPLLHVLPLLLEVPRPMPCAPPLDHRSSCHCPIRWVPETPSVGSTSALRKLRPPEAAICAASWDAHAVYGDVGADATTGAVTDATPAVEVAARAAPATSDK